MAMMTFWKNVHRGAVFDAAVVEQSQCNTNKTYRTRPVQDTSVDREMSDHREYTCEVNY